MSDPLAQSDAPALDLREVGVCYRVHRDRPQTLKEYAIRVLKRQIQVDSYWALRDVSLTVERGEMFGIVGRNGAGKSSLLRVMARVLQPSAGSITIRGRVAPLLELGAGFHADLSGRENIFLNGAVLGLRRSTIEDLFDEIVAFAELEDFIDAPLRTYSSGMGVRLGFAVATAVRPDILVIDEVMGVGDEGFQRKSRARIASYRREGTTIVYVSHGLDEVRRMCDRAAWIDGGRVQAVGESVVAVRAYFQALQKTPARTRAPMPDGRASARPAPPPTPAEPVVTVPASTAADQSGSTTVRQVWVHAAPCVLDGQAYNDLDTLVQPGDSCPASSVVEVLAQTPEWLSQYRLVRGEFGLATSEFLRINAVRVVVMVEPVAHILSLIDAIRLAPAHPLNGAFASYSDLDAVLDAMSAIPALWNPQARMLGYDFPRGFQLDAQSRGLPMLRHVEAHFTCRIDPEVPDAELLERATLRLRTVDSVVTGTSRAALTSAVAPLLGVPTPQAPPDRAPARRDEASRLTPAQRRKLEAMTRLDTALWDIATSRPQPVTSRVGSPSVTTIELLA